MSHVEQAASLLALQINALEMNCQAKQDAVYFDRWPSLAIRIIDVNANYLTTGSLVAHIDIQVELNQELPVTFIATCCTGMGLDLETALNDGLDAWLQADGSVVFSILNQGAIMNAMWCPKGDSFGIPGWDAFLSPYIVRGDVTDQQTLIEFVQANPLLDPIRQALEPHLDRQRLIQAISIFRGIASGEQYADCRINGQNVAALDAQLMASDWPVAMVSFGTVRQSLLLLNPQNI